MITTKADRKKPATDSPPVTKQRMCLMCSRKFPSGHVGERICPSCKGSSAWRNGGIAV